MTPAAGPSPSQRKPRGEATASKFPDDPSIRVELAESFRRDLGEQKQMSVAAAVDSPRRKGSARRLDPSSVSRYVGGKISPTLMMARRLAAAAGRPLAEAVAGYSTRHARSTESWAKQLLYARDYRAKALALVDRFSIVLRHIHFGVVSDRKRQYRRVVRPAGDRAEYTYVEITLEKPLGHIAQAEIIISYRLLDRPPIFIDFGRIELTPELVSGFELWTRRSHVERVAPDTSRLCIQTWIDGLATDFVIRSQCPFTLGPMLWPEQLPDEPRVVVAFHPGGIHRHARGDET